jgi:serine/threonine protein kinase
MIYKSKTNEYEVIKKLGEGASGITYLVASNNEKFVLKELKISNADNWKIIDRFKKEIENLKSLNHKNIPKYIDFIEDENNISYIQEYIDGESLENLIKKEISISQEELKSYLLQALNILNYINNLPTPLIHRDISPKNIIISNNQLFLIDLGVALSYEQNSNTVTTAGTFGYIAPEQIMGKPTPQSDIYSLGMTFISFINQTTVDNLPLLDNGKIDISKSVSVLPEKLQKILLSMTQSGITKRLENPYKGIKYLNGNINKLCFEEEPFSIKKYMRFRNFIYVTLILLFLNSIFNYYNLVKTDKYRVKVLGSLINGHSNVISTLTKVIFYDQTLIKGAERMYFLKTIKKDKYLISLTSKSAVLWNFNTEKIVWSSKIPFYVYNASVYMDKKEAFLYLINKYDKFKINLINGKIEKLKGFKITPELLFFKGNDSNKSNDDLKNKDTQIKKIIENPNRDEVVLIKSNYSYLYDKKENKEICKFENRSASSYSNNVQLSDTPKGLFSLFDKKIFNIFDNSCNQVKQIPAYSWNNVSTFTSNQKYFITSEEGGLIYVWKID